MVWIIFTLSPWLFCAVWYLLIMITIEQWFYFLISVLMSCFYSPYPSSLSSLASCTPRSYFVCSTACSTTSLCHQRLCSSLSSSYATWMMSAGVQELVQRLRSRLSKQTLQKWRKKVCGINNLYVYGVVHIAISKFYDMFLC